MRTVDWVLRAESLALFVAGVLLFLQLSGNALWLLPPPAGAKSACPTACCRSPWRTWACAGSAFPA